MEAEWHTLGKVQYQKWTLYELDWQRELGAGSDLRDFISAAAPFGGPVALLRDPKKLVKVDASAKLSRSVLVFSASGKKICEIPFAKYDEKDLTTNRAKDTLIFMGWTDELKLLLVFENGNCVTYSLTGELDTRFAILQSGAKDKIVSVEAWGGGFVALSERMVLIQALDIDSVRPKVSLLPDCGLSDANAPTCMAVIEPKFLKSIYPEVLLGTSNRSLVVVSKENGAQDMQLQESLKAPISAIAVGPSGVFMAVFSQDGLLTVMNTMLDKKVLTFDTQSKSTPLAMKWCGEDSVLLYWPNAGLIMVGPFGSWLRFPYDEGLVLAQEMDCCRVYRATGHDIVMRVPTSVENIKGIGSTAPAAMLFLAMDAFDAGDAKADEHIRSILSQKQMEIAIKDCITAAGSDFDYANQSAFLRAASYGKCFVDGGGAGSNASKADDKADDALDAEATDLDPELFVEMCRKVRVLNALRQQNVGLPLTLGQFDRLSPEVVVSRLVAMRHHLLALKICEYLKVPTDRVLVHWACEKVKASTDIPDEELVALVRSRLKNATLVSYADIASCAERVNRRRLATMFLDLEENATDQVPLLLSMGEFELALRKSLESNNADLVFMTLFHLERTLPSLEELATVLNLDPVYGEAASLMLQYYKASKSSKLRELSNACSDLSSAESAILLSMKVPDAEEKTAALKDAMVKLTNAKMPAAAKLAEEQLELVQEQKKLEGKPENIKKRQLVGLSVTDTMKILIQDTKYEPKLTTVVSAFAKKFKVPEKRFYRVKIKALAETKQWDALQKFSTEKKTPPCGFKAFAVACLEHGEKSQAEAYTARITAVDEKFDTLMHLELYHDALQLAIKLKDPEKLTSVRNLCGDVEICNLADKAAVDLGFVS